MFPGEMLRGQGTRGVDSRRGPERELSSGAAGRPSTARPLRALALLSGGALFLTVLGINLLGDGLRDRLDPRSA